VPAAWRDVLDRDPRVHQTGRVDDVVPYYRLMSLCVFPSYREGFPNVPMEAAAMGLPVVATRVVGCVDAVVDGTTGTLVPPRDAAALATAVGRYLEDPELGRRHGAAGRARVLRDFQQKPIWEALATEYRRLLYSRARASRARALASEAAR
jgi:glycosyltransferase involved in cell wall biosynthesis